MRRQAKGKATTKIQPPEVLLKHMAPVANFVISALPILPPLGVLIS